MDENLMMSLKSAQESLDELQEISSPQQYSERSLLKLSNALKNIDKEINRLGDPMNYNIKNSA